MLLKTRVGMAADKPQNVSGLVRNVPHCSVCALYGRGHLSKMTSCVFFSPL